MSNKIRIKPIVAFLLISLIGTTNSKQNYPIVKSKPNLQLAVTSNTSSDQHINSLQKNIDQLTQDGHLFPKKDLFNTMTLDSNLVSKSTDFNEQSQKVGAKFFTLDKASLNNFNASPNESMILSIPYSNKSRSNTKMSRPIQLKLFKTKIYTDDAEFIEKTGMNDKGRNLDRNTLDLGVHYQGIVVGEKDSIVAISIYNNAIEGRIHSHKLGDLNLGRIKTKPSKGKHITSKASPFSENANDVHTIFKIDSIAHLRPEHYCGSQLLKDMDRRDLIAMDQNLNLKSKLIQGAMNSKVYDYYFTTKTTLSGYLVSSIGVNNLSHWIGSVLNQAAAVYRVEKVNLYSEGWNYYTSSPVYDSSTGANLIQQFNYYDGSGVANSDVGIVLTGSGSSNSGGLAYKIGGVCDGTTLNRLSMAKVNSSWSYFPNYSWTVDVYVHEIGHTLGSRHTHACVWNGNNTAIDSCSGFTEGNCALPGTPAFGQGTVMSYCHSSVGKNPALGFGYQPGNKIRSYVYYCASR